MNKIKSNNELLEDVLSNYDNSLKEKIRNAIKQYEILIKDRDKYVGHISRTKTPLPDNDEQFDI